MRFDLWTVTGPDPDRKYRVQCVCACGVTKSVYRYDLVGGKSTNCGCLKNENASKRFTTHGYSKHPLYSIWLLMIDRCTNPENPRYKDYGGRSIRVCSEWMTSFEAFAAHMGEKPGPWWSVERIDNDGHYEPSNVRFATPKEQGRNRRTNRLIEFRGKTLPMAAWAERFNLDREEPAASLAP